MVTLILPLIPIPLPVILSHLSYPCHPSHHCITFQCSYKLHLQTHSLSAPSTLLTTCWPSPPTLWMWPPIWFSPPRLPSYPTSQSHLTRTLSLSEFLNSFVEMLEDWLNPLHQPIFGTLSSINMVRATWWTSTINFSHPINTPSANWLNSRERWVLILPLALPSTLRNHDICFKPHFVTLFWNKHGSNCHYKQLLLVQTICLFYVNFRWLHWLSEILNNVSFKIFRSCGKVHNLFLNW